MKDLAVTLQFKLKRSLKKRGFWATLAQGPAALKSFLFSERRRRVKALYRVDAFDSEFAIDTRGTMVSSDVDLSNPHSLYSVPYQPTHTAAFQPMLSFLHISYDQFIFIDVGSGKGRVLLLASDFPFQKIIGLEFSPGLHKIAETNIARYSKPTQRCKDIQSIFADACTFPFPEVPTVFYLYNPFEAAVLQEFLLRLNESLTVAPRTVYLIYYNPVHRSLLDGAGFFRQLVAASEYAIYISHQEPPTR